MAGGWSYFTEAPSCFHLAGGEPSLRGAGVFSAGLRLCPGGADRGWCDAGRGVSVWERVQGSDKEPVSPGAQGSTLEVQLGQWVGGSLGAQGQGVGLWVLASQGGVRVMSEGSSTAPALAGAAVRAALAGAALGGDVPFAAVSVAREAAEGFGGVWGGTAEQTVSWPSKQLPKWNNWVPFW